MSSINTNLGAMVALDTLKGINKNLGMVQNEISTGKSINSAKDNAAIWSISTVMETDVAGFEKIGNSLNLGSATLGVARTAAEDVVSNLQDIRATIIDAQGENVDRDTLQFDIDEAVKQIKSTISGAQFNGQNLLNSSGEIKVLSSLDRSADGSVAANQISVSKANLTTTDTRVDIASTDAGYAASTSTAAEYVAGEAVDVKALTIDAAAEDNIYSLTVNGEDVTYTAGAADTAADVAAALVAAITTADPTGVTANVNNDDLTQIDFTIAADTDASLSGVTVTNTGAPVASAVTVGDAGDQTALNNSEVTFVSPLDNRTAPDAVGVQGLEIGTVADNTDYEYSFTIGGEDISFTGVGGDETAVAAGIVDAINLAAPTGITARADGANVVFDIDAGTDATISGLTVADDTGAGVASGDADGVVVGNAGDQAALNVSDVAADLSDVKAIEIGSVAAGEATNSLYEATVGGKTASYTATATDTQDDIAAGLVAAINDLGVDGVTAKVNGTTASQIDFDVEGGTNADVTLSQKQVEDGSAFGALVGLDTIDVTTDEGAAAALTAIEGFLNSAIDSAAEFGAKQTRIDSQIDFVSSLGDSLKAGISTLTDANLEEASARLQALQVQQQLGVQALSIANQAPQALLGLFR